MRSLNHPEPVAPTKLKTAIIASMLAAATSDMPLSEHAATRCVPIRPFVDAPQTKKLPASSQKSRERKPVPRAANATRTGFPGLADGGALVPGASP
jgi:hypothetical protein